jgi:hypothetical protein
MIFCEAIPFQNSNCKKVHPVFRGKKHVHLMADDELELRLYAQNMLKMKSSWLQRSSWGIPHFDVTGWRMEFVLKDPKVVKMNRQTFAEWLRNLRLRAQRIVA